MAGAAKLTVGAVFARDFRVLRPLAEGGMGAVYVVEQISTRKKRALKIVRTELIGDTKAAERFVQEATVAAGIQSEHVVEVIAAGVDEGTGLPWMAMELLDGDDLDAVVTQRGRLPVALALEVFQQLCHGLAAAHAAGVVHRDLKPENVFVARSRRADAPFTVKVLDFGIAKVMQESKRSATTTTVIGSPLWMAPEQIKAERISPETDVWALGLIAFWLLTGRNYWRAANGESVTLEALLAEKLFGEIDPPSVRAAQLGCAEPLPAGFDAWFLQCVAREPAQRFRDAGMAFDALRPVLTTAAAIGPSRDGFSLLAPAAAPSLAPAAQPTLRGQSANRSAADAFAPTLARDSGSLAGTTRRSGGRTTLAYSAGAVLLLAAGAYAGVRFKSAMRERATVHDTTPTGDTEHEARPVPPTPTITNAPEIPTQIPKDASAPSTVVTPPPDADEAQRIHAATHTRTHAVTVEAPTASANAHPPPAPAPAPARPMPPVSSQLAALASLEAQAERTEQQAASEPNPQRAAALRDAARSIRRSADEHLDQEESMARGMMATEPGNAGVLLNYVREGREFLRRRRAGHP